MTQHQGKTILYVDDEEINQFIFTKYFESQFKIITASSGVEAMRLLDKNWNEIDVVISDMRMPGMDGIEFIRNAKEQFKRQAYYLLTAFTNSAELDDALNEKLVDKIFNKPYDVSIVRKELESLG